MKKLVFAVLAVVALSPSLAFAISADDVLRGPKVPVLGEKATDTRDCRFYQGFTPPTQSRELAERYRACNAAAKR